MIIFTQAHVPGGVYGTYSTTVSVIMMIILKQILMQKQIAPCSIDGHYVVLHSSCSGHRFITLISFWVRTSAPHLKHIASLSSARRGERMLWIQESSAFCHLFVLAHSFPSIHPFILVMHAFSMFLKCHSWQMKIGTKWKFCYKQTRKSRSFFHRKAFPPMFVSTYIQIWCLWIITKILVSHTNLSRLQMQYSSQIMDCLCDTFIEFSGYITKQ